MARKMPYAGQRNQRTEIVRLIVAGLTGSLANPLTAIAEGTYHCKALRSAAGVFAIQLNSDKLYARPPNVLIQAISATGVVTSVLTALPTASGLISFNCYTSSTGVAVDPTQIMVTIEGSDSVDQV